MGIVYVIWKTELYKEKVGHLQPNHCSSVYFSLNSYYISHIWIGPKREWWYTPLIPSTWEAKKD